MAGTRVHVVMPAELVARVDAVRGESVSRGEFVRRAVEQALSELKRQSIRRTHPMQADPGSVSSSEGVGSAAPAEQPGAFVRAVEAEVAASMAARDAEEARIVGGRYRQHVPGPDVENIRSSGQAKRDVRPVPKKGA